MTSTLETMKASLGVRKEPIMHEGDGLAKSDSSESVSERKDVLVAHKPKQRYAQATLPLKQDAMGDSDSEDMSIKVIDARKPKSCYTQATLPLK
jgi:hypothetical protein